MINMAVAAKIKKGFPTLQKVGNPAANCHRCTD
jgi:hypothetical protein